MPESLFWHRCFPVNFKKFLRKPFYGTRLDVELRQHPVLRYVPLLKFFDISLVVEWLMYSKKFSHLADKNYSCI